MRFDGILYWVFRIIGFISFSMINLSNNDIFNLWLYSDNTVGGNCCWSPNKSILVFKFDLRSGIKIAGSIDCEHSSIII